MAMQSTGKRFSPRRVVFEFLAGKASLTGTFISNHVEAGEGSSSLKKPLVGRINRDVFRSSA